MVNLLIISKLKTEDINYEFTKFQSIANFHPKSLLIHISFTKKYEVIFY